MVVFAVAPIKLCLCFMENRERDHSLWQERQSGVKLSGVRSAMIHFFSTVTEVWRMTHLGPNLLHISIRLTSSVLRAIFSYIHLCICLVPHYITAAAQHSVQQLLSLIQCCVFMSTNNDITHWDKPVAPSFFQLKTILKLSKTAGGFKAQSGLLCCCHLGSNLTLLFLTPVKVAKSCA